MEKITDLLSGLLNGKYKLIEVTRSNEEVSDTEVIAHFNFSVSTKKPRNKQGN